MSRLTVLLVLCTVVLSFSFSVAAMNGAAHDVSIDERYRRTSERLDGAAVTVISSVTFDEAWSVIDKDEVWLASLTPDQTDPGRGIGLVWSEAAAGWFSVWKIQWQANGSRRDVATIAPKAGHTYGTTVSYDPVAKVIAIRVVDETAGEIIHRGHFEIESDTTGLYAVAGPIGRSGAAASGRIALDSINLYDVFIPVSSTVRLVTRDNPSFALRKTDRDTQFLLRVLTPGPDAGGEYWVHLRHHDTGKTLEIGPMVAAGQETDQPISLTDLPGVSTVALSYVKNNDVIDLDAFDVSVGRLTVEFGTAHLDVKNRRAHVDMTVSSDAPTPHLSVTVEAALRFAMKDDETRKLRVHDFEPVQAFDGVIEAGPRATTIPVTVTLPSTEKGGLWQVTFDVHVGSSISVEKANVEKLVADRIGPEYVHASAPQVPVGGAALSVEEEARLRKEAAQRRRRILYNNDGGDSRVPSSHLSIDAFLAVRTTPLIGSQVDTIIFDTTAGSFGSFAHWTEVGEIFLTREGRYAHNMTSQLIFEHETDPLQVQLDFARENGFEFFWTVRMNDTHDASNDLLLTDFKKNNPDLLFGTRTQRPQFGQWSGVDYSDARIRELAFRFVEEVAENYDVDGILLDFFRHPVFFKDVASGGPVTLDHLDQMTGVVQRIRDRLKEIGRMRGRPILLAVRVPDSVELNRMIGIDIERWLANDLVDLLITGGYFRLSRVEQSVRLGHAHGVPVYPSLDESRIETESVSPNRATIQVYRARAAALWQAGADGVHLFNMFNPNHPMLWEIGDPHTLIGKEKAYFTAVRGGAGSADPNRLVNSDKDFFNYSFVTPDSPRVLWSDTPVVLDLDVGEQLDAARRRGFKPTVTLRVVAPERAQEWLSVAMNGHWLSHPKVHSAGYLEYDVNPDWIVDGLNQLAFQVREGAVIKQTYRAPSLPRSSDYVIIQELDVTTPDNNSLNIRVKAASGGAGKLGSVSIRTPNPGNEPLPPGFVRAANGYGYPQGLPSPGYSFNGPHDEDPDPTSFTITLPMDGGIPGEYVVSVIVQTRPHTGTYYSNSRPVVFRINEQGEVHMSAILSDVQLHVRYD